MFHEIFGAIAVVLTLIGLVPYLYGSWRGYTTPHMFTWLIWTTMTVITFLAQVAGNGGPGAWTTGVTAVLCLPILAIAIAKGKRNIRPIDFISLVAAVIAGLFWIATDDPTITVILVTAIDAVAFIPTIRKSWWKPHEEVMLNNVTSMAKHFLSIAALTEVSIVTACFPLVVGAMNLLMIIVLTTRRRALKEKSVVLTPMNSVAPAGRKR